MKLAGEDFQHLDLEVSDDVLTVTLDRPEHLNAINGPMHEELTHLVATLRADDAVGAVVLTGRGRAFCAGGDAGWFASASDREIDRLFRDGRTLIVDLLEIRPPVIAAVNGPAVGLGATLALFSDVVIAAETASFADPHVQMGVTAGDGGAAIWPWLVGMARAKHYLLTGDRVDASEAERIGLVNQLVPSELCLPTARALAVRLARGPRQAITSTKSTINQVLRQTTALVLDVGLTAERETLRSHDHREAVAAFGEGRPPRFTGR